MLQFSARQLRGVEARTRSGERIGVLKDLVIEQETIRLAAVVIRPEGVVNALLAGDLIIPIDKVISISLEEIVVEDAAIPVPAEKEKKEMPLIRENDAVLSSEREA